MLRRTGLAIGLIIVVVSNCRASGKGALAGQQNGWPVQLLPGFKWTFIPGIDSGGGMISNKDGLNIEVGLCCGFAIEADEVSKNRVLWHDEQIVNGERVLLVFTKSKELIISFPISTARAINFRAKIRSQKELAEMLLMVLTYQPPPHPRLPASP